MSIDEALGKLIGAIEENGESDRVAGMDDAFDLVSGLLFANDVLVIDENYCAVANKKVTHKQLKRFVKQFFQTWKEVIKGEN